MSITNPFVLVFYTNISTSVHSASIQTFTAYSWNSPSYSYSSHPETTVYSTAISSTILVNTKGNYTTVSCWESCVAGIGASSSSAQPTVKLTTASVLTTINKDPIIATLPAGIANITPTQPKPTPTPSKPIQSPTTAANTPSPDITTAKATATASKPPQTKVSPTAPSDQAPSSPEVEAGATSDTCTDAFCALAAAITAALQPAHQTASGEHTDANPVVVPVTTEGGDSAEAITGAVITAGTQIVSIAVASGGAIVVGSTTIAPGHVLTLPNNQIISAGSSAVHLDGSEIPMSVASASPLVTNAVFTAGSETFTASPVGGGSVAIGSITVAKGQSVTLPNGQAVGVGASAINVDGSEIPFSTNGASEPAVTGLVFTNAAGEVETATQISSGVFIAASTTLTAGQHLTLPNGDVATIALGASLPSSGNGAAFTAGEQKITASEIRSGVFAIGTATLSVGQQLTLSNGDIIQANSNGIQLGTSTLKLSALGSETTGVGFYTIDHQTLTPGGVIIEGTATISMDESGQTYYADGSPTPVSLGVIHVNGTKYTAHTTTGTAKVGDYIMGGISSSASHSASNARKTRSSTEPGTSSTSKSFGTRAVGASIGSVMGLALVAVVAAML